MQLSVEGVGKKIDDAIENALFELKVPREDVDIKILEQGGFFKKAKVLVTISEDARVKYEKKNEKRKEVTSIEVKVEKKAIREAVNAYTRKIISDEEISVNDTKPEKEWLKRQMPATNEGLKVIRSIKAKEFLEGLLIICGKTAQIKECTAEDGATILKVTGENLNDLIGHRGETLYAISYLTSIFGEKNERVRVDMENYRERRNETLELLAKRVAEKVARTGKYAKLEPMEAGERRIVHMTLQESEEVETISKGQEPYRYLMIVPKNKHNKKEEV